MFIVFAMYAISTLSLSKMILTYTQPFFLIGSRMTLAGIFLLAYAVLWKKLQWPENFKTVGLHYFQIILFALCIPYFLRYWGLLSVPEPRLTLLYNLGPLFTFVACVVLGIEKCTLQKILALLLGYCGLLLFLHQPLTAYFSQPFCFADGAIVVSVLSFVYGWLLIAQRLREYNDNVVVLNGICMLGAGLLGFTFSYIHEVQPYVADISSFIPLLLGIIVISNLFTHNLYAVCVKKYGLSLVQLASLVAPMFSALIASVAANKLPSISLLTSTVITLSSCYLFYSDQCKVQVFTKKVRQERSQELQLS